MHNLYSKFIEITTLTVVIFSVYLLSIEIKKYTEATNIATYQKISEGFNDLTMRRVESSYLREIDLIVMKYGTNALKNEIDKTSYFIYLSAMLRLTEVAYKSWKKEILDGDEKNRFSVAECMAYHNINNLNRRLFITQEYKNYLKESCKK